jgi:hypothetical protein
MKQIVRDVLDDIADSDPNGWLRPEAVLARAQAQDSVLHGYFTWEDDAAAAHWRLHEARNLIRHYTVWIEQSPLPIKTRAFVSLKSARVAGSGYTSIRRILSDEEKHRELLANAMDEFQYMEKKYGHLLELKPIFHVVRRVRRRAPRESHHAVA